MRLAVALAAAIVATSAPAAGDGLFLQFPRQARIWVQVGQDGKDSPVSEQFLVFLPTTLKGRQRPLQGYLLEAGTTQCDPALRACRDARATPSVQDPFRLPDKFEILVDERDEPSIAGGGVEVETFGLDATHGLREGATGRIECVRNIPFCLVAIRYAPRIRLRFLAAGKGDATDRIRAVDGFMRDAIKSKAQPAWGNPASGLAGIEVRS